MSRTERLFEIIEILRRSKCAVTASELSSRFEVSRRSIYRDIALLRAQGVPVDGEAGVGYILRSGYTLPPLMFSVQEMEALLLGLQWVSVTADRDLTVASKNALAKIRAVEPSPRLSKYRSSNLIISRSFKPQVDDRLLAALRKAIKDNTKISIHYCDQNGRQTSRIIWPFAIGFMNKSQLVAAWCEKRASFRCFRADRIWKWDVKAETFPTSHTQLFNRWIEEEQLIFDIIEW